MEMNEVYGGAIKNMRKRHGMTQKDLADELNVTPQAISNWERGKCRPDEDIRSVLGNKFDVFWGRQHYHYETGDNKEMKLKLLSEIETMEEIEEAAHYLIDTVHFDLAYQNTLRYISSLVLTMAIGCYKGMEWISKLDDKSKDSWDDFCDLADPNEDWYAVSIIIRQILDSYISLNVDDEYGDDALLNDEIALLYEDYINPMRETYMRYNEQYENDLTYRLLDVASDAWEFEARVLFLSGGLEEPSPVALCLRASLLALSDNIADEFGKTMASKKTMVSKATE